ncbi:hypothetical protein [Psychromonas hadalis]|uniref:hypothetical protein n=1 Tax=Psychromonas hadalis TaxID=211669 RepID=UPI0003B37EA4|nr:hypothetical protein [Psychromonas hadalis]
MRKVFYGLILITSLVTVGLQYAYIQKLEGDVAYLKVLYEKIEKEFNELNLLGKDV